jgi:D-erythro-7,8-dihydroneopterin triphosphate epimerase
VSSASLHIHELSLWVNLGIRDIEKMERQEIRLSVDLEFSKKPEACQTDKVADTVCYHELCCQIITLVEEKSYAMLEKIAQEILDLIKNETSSDVKVKVRLHKVRPPIARLEGGVSFTLSS